MTAMIGGEGQCRQLSVEGGCLARKCAERWPVVELVHLPIDYFRRLPHDVPPSGANGRRPSDVYGEPARRRWTEAQGQRPLARSAAAIRAARSAKVVVPTTDGLLSSVTSTSQSSQLDDSTTEIEKTLPGIEDTLTRVDSPQSTTDNAAHPVRSSERTSLHDSLVLYFKKFRSSRSAAIPKYKTLPSPESHAESSDDGRRQCSNTDCVQTSSLVSSKHDRKRKSVQELTPKRAKKTHRNTSSKKDGLDDQNTPLPATELNSEHHSISTNLQHEDGTSSGTSSAATAPNEEKTTDVNDVKINSDQAATCDDGLPVDEKPASMSLAAVDEEVSLDTVQPTPDTTESLTVEPVVEVSNVELPVNPKPLATAVDVPSSRVGVVELSTRTENKTSSRAEQTIFERFIDALALHKPLTPNEEEQDEKTAVTSGSTTEPERVQVVTDEAAVEVQENVTETDSEQVNATEKQTLDEASVADASETSHSSTKADCSQPAEIDAKQISTTHGARYDVFNFETDSLVESIDKNALKSRNREAESNDDAAQNSSYAGGRAHCIKKFTKYAVETNSLASRPVRNRQPTFRSFEANFFNYSVPSKHKKKRPTKPGSCLLPPDFVASTVSAKSTQKSWKPPDKEKRNSLPARTSPIRPADKNKRKHARRKNRSTENVNGGVVEWTFSKKLLLGGPTSITGAPSVSGPKSITGARSKKPKPKPSTQSTSSGTDRGQLVTRSKTRERKTHPAGARHSSAKITTPTTEVNVFTRLNEVHESGSEISASCTPVHLTSTTITTTTVTSVCTASVTSTVTTSIKAEQCIESAAIDDAFEVVPTSADEKIVQHDEPELHVASDDVVSRDETTAAAAVTTDSENSVSTTTTTTTTNSSDTTKVDDESVEALMQLIKQLQDAVVNEKARKAKEKMKVKRSQQGFHPRARTIRSTSCVDESTSTLPSQSLSGQAVALALGLGPRFNWLENKINTMQASSSLPKLWPRPVMPQTTAMDSGLMQSNPVSGGTAVSVMSVVPLYRSLSDSVGGGTTVSTVSVATVSTSTPSTTSPLQTSSAVLQHGCVVSTMSPNNTDNNESYTVEDSSTPCVDQPQPLASEQAEAGAVDIGPLVIDLEDSSDMSSEFPSASTAASCVLTQSSDQLPVVDSQSPLGTNLDSTSSDVSHEVSKTTELSDTTDEHTGPGAAVDLTTIPRDLCADVTEMTSVASRHECSAAAETDASGDAAPAVSCSATAPHPPSVVVLEEYNRRYEKYKRLCELIALKDRELMQLKDEQQKLHRLLEETRLPATSTDSTEANQREPTAANAEQEEKADVTSRGAPATSTAATGSYRHRPAHRGVTSVRVMVKSTLPPTAHTARINLSRYNSLFCNYDEAASHSRPPSEAAAGTSQDDSSCRGLPTDLTHHSGRASAETSTDGFRRPDSGPRSEESCAAYVIDVEQHSRRPSDVSQTGCRPTVVESSVRRHESTPDTSIAPGTDVVSESGVAVDSQRAVRQSVDPPRHQLTTSETVISAVHRRASTDSVRVGTDQSTGILQRTGADCAAERVELRQPPPYSQQHQTVPHPLAASVVPVLIRDQTGAVEPAASAVVYASQKDQSAGPKTVYVQPMRAENRDPAPVQPSCNSKDPGAVMWQASSSADRVSSKRTPTSMNAAAAALPTRQAAVQQPIDNLHTYQLRHAVPDVVAQRSKLGCCAPNSRLSYPVTSRPPVDEVVVQQRLVERRPLHQLAQFVDGRQQQQYVDGALPRAQLDAADPRKMPPTQHFTGATTSGHVIDVTGSRPVDYGHRDLAPSSAPSATSETQLSQQQQQQRYVASCYRQSAAQPRFVAPPPPALQRDPPPSYPRVDHPPRAVPTGSRTAAPLDMSQTAKQRRSTHSVASSLSQAAVVAQGYTRHPTPVQHDYINAPRQEVPRRPVTDQYRNYVPADGGSSAVKLSQPQDVSAFFAPSRAPHGNQYAGTDYQAPRRRDQSSEQDVLSMRCETCSRPAMFICSACKKASYCSVDCQAKSWRLRHSAVCRRP